MGVDAVLFAEKAKKYFYYDREHNLLRFIDDAQYTIYEDELKRKGKLADYQMLYFLETNIEDIKRTDPGRLSNNLALREFVRMFPGDNFFTYSDHDNPDYHDIAKKGGYEEIEWKQIYPIIQKECELINILYYDY